MNITQETANLIDTLARAAAQIGSTAASARLNQVIVELLTATADSPESIAEALRQDNAALQQELISTQKSALIMAENLEFLRGKMVMINQIAVELIGTTPVEEGGEELEIIRNLSKPIDTPAA